MGSSMFVAWALSKGVRVIPFFDQNAMFRFQCLSGIVSPTLCLSCTVLHALFTPHEQFSSMHVIYCHAVQVRTMRLCMAAVGLAVVFGSWHFQQRKLALEAASGSVGWVEGVGGGLKLEGG